MQQERNQSPRSNRGFASMDAQKQREIASKGGKASHEKGSAHEFTPEEARVAGRKGGEAVSRNREHMAAIGREGGKASHRGHARRDSQPVRTDEQPQEVPSEQQKPSSEGTDLPS